MIRILALLGGLTLVGTLGLWLIEGWSFLDSLYMTVITLTTVGYSETKPLSDAGRIFIMGYLVVGIGVFFYGVATLGEIIVRSQFTDWLGKRKMDTKLKTMKDHYIVCGLGRMGESICQQLEARKLPFVVIERSQSALERADPNWQCLVGDATEDQVLEQAGLERSRGLAAVLGTDADNLYIVLTARLARAELLILARAADDRAVEKMEKAGANRVVSLYKTGASKIVQLLSRPNVEDFIEIAAGTGQEIDLAEIHVANSAGYCGKTLADSDLRDRGIIVVRIRRRDGQVLMPPPSTARIEAGDSLLALGRREVVHELIADS